MRDDVVPPATRLADIALHAARMDEPLVSYRLLAAGGRATPPSPAFLFGPCNAALARTIYGQIELPEVGVFSVAAAAVGPTGVALREGVAFFGSALNLPAEHVGTIGRRLAEAALPVRFVEGPLLVLFGPAEEAYAQLITDYLPRLFLVQAAGFDFAALRILVPDNLPPHVEDVFANLHLPAENVVRYAHWQEVIRTDLLVLPSVLRRHERLGAAFGAATRFWTGRVLDGVQAGMVRRLFLITPECPRNTDRLEAMAVASGFVVVHPHTMDVAARAAMFAGATHVVGPYGRWLHDSVFAPVGTRVLALRDTQREPGFLQSGIGAALGQPTGYVFVAEDNTVDENDFRRAVELMLLGASDVDG